MVESNDQATIPELTSIDSFPTLVYMTNHGKTQTTFEEERTVPKILSWLTQQRNKHRGGGCGKKRKAAARRCTRRRRKSVPMRIRIRFT